MKGSSVQIVLTPRWFLVCVMFGWLFVLAGTLFVLFVIVYIAEFLSGAVLLPVSAEPSLGLVALGAGLGIPLLLLGIWLAGFRTKMTSSPGSACITLIRGKFPIYIPRLRTRRISRQEARTAYVDAVSRTYRDWSTPLSQDIIEYQIMVQRTSGDLLKIIDAGRKKWMAEDLVKRIRAFAGEKIIGELPNTPKDAYLFLLSKLEAQGGNYVTLQYKSYESRWVQVAFDKETALSFSYPYDENPNQRISKLGIFFPEGYVLSDWEPHTFATVCGPRCRHSELANTIDRLFTEILGAPPNYVVEGWIA